MRQSVVKVGSGVVIFLIGATCAGVGTTAVFSHRAAEREARDTSPIKAEIEAPDDRPARAVSPVSAPTAPSHDPRRERTWSRPVEVRDRAHVDITELMPQAIRVATELQPGAKFFHARAWSFHRGTMNLDHRGAPQRLLFHFQWGTHDKSRPPGEDLVQVNVDVTLSAAGDELVARASPGALATHYGGELPAAPGCSAERAFEAAIASGVPANAVAGLTYDNDYLDHGALVWKLDVDGHREFGRSIDAQTCVITKDWSR